MRSRYITCAVTAHNVVAPHKHSIRSDPLISLPQSSATAYFLVCPFHHGLAESRGPQRILGRQRLSTRSKDRDLIPETRVSRPGCDGFGRGHPFRSSRKTGLYDRPATHTCLRTPNCAAVRGLGRAARNGGPNVRQQPQPERIGRLTPAASWQTDRRSWAKSVTSSAATGVDRR